MIFINNDKNNNMIMISIMVRITISCILDLWNIFTNILITPLMPVSISQVEILRLWFSALSNLTIGK